jgi:hypothetical protein
MELRLPDAVLAMYDMTYLEVSVLPLPLSPLGGEGGGGEKIGGKDGILRVEGGGKAAAAIDPTL